MKYYDILKKFSFNVLVSSLILTLPALSSDPTNKGKEEAFPAQPTVVSSINPTPAEQILAINERFRHHHIPTHKENPEALVRMLSLDGGGLRGLIFLPQLRALEILTGKPIHELFDLIGGTSTGGISALGLAYQDETGRVATCKDIINLYLKCGREIFKYRPGIVHLANKMGGAKHDPSGLENVICKLVGEDKFQSHKFKIPVLITAVNANHRCLKIFSCLNEQDAEVPIWQIARATSAAQTFFPAIAIGETAYIDGGHISNCPAWDFTGHYVENMSKHPQFQGNNKLSIFSFGTGNISLVHETSAILNEYILGKIESTIGCLFTAQEASTEQSIRRELKLFDTNRRLLSSLIASKKKMVQFMEFVSLQSEAIQLLMEKEKLAPQPMDLSGFASLCAEMKEQDPIIAQLEQQIKEAAVELEQHSWIQSYSRSQTQPLDDRNLHEMDDCSKAPALFAEGLKMLKAHSFKQMLRGIFGEDFQISDSILDYVHDQIRDEVNYIDIMDERPFTLLAIVCDFLTQKELKGNNYNYFKDRLALSGYGDLSKLGLDQLNLLFAWTHKLQEVNQEHSGKRSILSKCDPTKILLYGGHSLLSYYLYYLRTEIEANRIKKLGPNY